MNRRPSFVSVLARSATLAWVAALAVPAPAAAQIARMRTAPPDAPKMLIVTFQREDVDSAVAVTLPDGFRDRIQSAHLSRFNPILKDGMCRALTESGFPCDVPLESSVWRQLARFLNARLLVEGNVIRQGGDSVLIIARLAETTGTQPQSATASITMPRTRANASTGADLANRLADAYRSFEDVQQCRQALEAQRYDRAVQEVESALRRNPNSATALLCLANVLRAQNVPMDSIVRVLHRAADVDSLNTTVRRQLAQFYQEQGDTTNLLLQLRAILRVDVRDNDLRISTARLLIQMGARTGDTAVATAYADSAVQVINQGLERNPANIELLTIKSIALGGARRWADAAQQLSLVASADSQHVDSLFLYRINAYYQAVPDTANMLLWTEIATVKVPEEAPYWYQLSLLRIARADTIGALNAGREYVTRAPTDCRGHLQMARIYVGIMAIDSAVAHVACVDADSSLRPFAAPIYLQAGARFLRDSAWADAAGHFQRAKDYGTGQSQMIAALYLGIAQLQMGAQADTRANANRNDCESVLLEQDLLTQAEANIIAGARTNPNLANQLLTGAIPAYKQRADAFFRNYRCVRAETVGTTSP